MIILFRVKHSRKRKAADATASTLTAYVPTAVETRAAFMAPTVSLAQTLTRLHANVLVPFNSEHYSTKHEGRDEPGREPYMGRRPNCTKL